MLMLLSETDHLYLVSTPVLGSGVVLTREILGESGTHHQPARINTLISDLSRGRDHSTGTRLA
jgi:hypothetical protein